MKYLGKISDGKDLITKEFVDNKLVTTTLASVAANNVDPTSARLYAVRLDSAGHYAVQVPWTDATVAQTATTTNSSYEVLFSGTADNTTRTEGVRKSSTLKYNPSTKAFVTGGTVDGYTLAAACAKGVTDTTTPNPTTLSTDVNLVTGKTLYYAIYGSMEGYY